MILIIKRTSWLLFAVIAIMAAYIFLSHPDWLVIPPYEKVAALSSDKACVNDNSCTDPNRPYFDGFGNKFDYMGNLITAACPNQPDPISGQDNPYCTCQSNQYLQGYDKETGRAVCHDEAVPVQSVTPPPTDNEVFYGK